MNNRKLLSTLLLFAVFIGFLWWGLSMLTSTLNAPVKDGESIVYALLLLGCAGYALVSILLLPRKNQP
jgi:TRAP-type C4-dicarboxylate transport system permease small subunit